MSSLSWRLQWLPDIDRSQRIWSPPLEHHTPHPHCMGTWARPTPPPAGLLQPRRLREDAQEERGCSFPASWRCICSFWLYLLNTASRASRLCKGQWDLLQPLAAHLHFLLLFLALLATPLPGPKQFSLRCPSGLGAIGGYFCFRSWHPSAETDPLLLLPFSPLKEMPNRWPPDRWSHELLQLSWEWPFPLLLAHPMLLWREITLMSGKEHKVRLQLHHLVAMQTWAST